MSSLRDAALVARPGSHAAFRGCLRLSFPHSAPFQPQPGPQRRGQAAYGPRAGFPVLSFLTPLIDLGHGAASGRTRDPQRCVAADSASVLPF